MPFVIAITLLFSAFAFQSVLHAQVDYRTITPGKHFIPESTSFQTLLAAYKQVDFQRSIQEAKRLKRKRSDKIVAERAAFILGELYLLMAEKGRPLKYAKAINAFRDARGRYPNSNQALPALWKTGEIYIRRKLYYEALASFKRILKKHPESRFVIPAKLGRAKTYLVWGKWKKAIQELDSVDPVRLSRQERTMLLLGYADAYYHLDNPASSYQYYKLVSPKDKALQKSPGNLLQYGKVAFKTNDYERARKVLSILYTRNKRAPEAPLALARIGDTWRLGRFSQQAKKIYESVRAIKSNRPGIENARLVSAVGNLHISGCSPRPLMTTKADCRDRNVLNRSDGHQALKEIKEAAALILALEGKLSSLSEELLLEAIAAMEQHGAYSAALKIEEMILKKDLPFKLKMKVEKFVRTTALKTVHQLIKRNHTLELLAVYYQHRTLFTPKKLEEDTAFQIGIVLDQSELYEESIELLSPVARNKKGKHAREALFYLANAQFLLRDDDASAEHIKDYLERYPKSARIPLLQGLSIKIASRQNRHQEIIQKARTWLKQYPKHRDREKMLRLLATALEEKGKLKEAVGVYLKIKPEKKSDRILNLKIADLYYRLKAYKKAIPWYEKAIQASVDGEKSEWATFQLAKSYEALGQLEKGKPLFLQLAKNSEDPLIKTFSAEKAKTLVNP